MDKRAEPEESEDCDINDSSHESCKPSFKKARGTPCVPYVEGSQITAGCRGNDVPLIGSGRIWERGAALISRRQSLKIDLRTPEENLAGLQSGGVTGGS